MQRWFAMTTLSPWITKLEHEFRRSVFSEASRRTHRLELDLQGLLRGDPETRWQSHKIAVEANILTRDEVRELEGWPPQPAAAG
jgi:HK97 family phage portal protein